MSVRLVTFIAYEWNVSQKSDTNLKQVYYLHFKVTVRKFWYEIYKIVRIMKTSHLV